MNGLTKKALLILSSLIICILPSAAQKTQIKYLSGTDKDHTVEWEFFCTDGMNSGHWTTIQVPSCWEQQGFGHYNYGHDKDPFKEQGHYRYKFNIPASWKGQRVRIAFEGVMTDATVSINGKAAGEKHQGAFYPFHYEISELLKYGQENTLEVLVDKESSNPSINKAERRADYWVFGGIFRPVYLEALPQDFIERVAIDARHTGNFSAQAFIDLKDSDADKVNVELSICTLDGKSICKPFIANGVSPDGAITLAGKVDKPQTWSAETPNIYKAVFKLKKGGKVLHEYSQNFGFRTIEFRAGDGIYVNDRKMKFKGVCRHTFWPESGRTSSPELAISDVKLMKEMNMNAVRMSHYPPDRYFLDACDSLGLYVLDEVAGWQDAYDINTAHRVIRDMIQRDVNHPSIVMWDNGNEGGFNIQARQDYAIWDPQHRHIVEPWSKLDGLNTSHYPKYDPVYKALTEGDMVFMPTESIHGLHDGGHGAGLDDYWNLILKSPLAAGQFLWVFADEGVIRHDQRDSIDVFNDKAPDGILGPHHEKEGSFFTIKQIWSPVMVSDPVLDGNFDGTLSIENRYDFTNLSQCSFSYGLTSYPKPLEAASVKEISGEVKSIDLGPWQQGKIALNLPADWRKYDVLSFSAFGPSGEELFTWKWNISKPAELAKRLINESIASGAGIGSRKVSSVLNDLNPRIVGIDSDNWSIVTTEYEGGVVKIRYSYTLDGDYDYAGIGFSYPEQGVTGATLLGKGPYRVWKNRLKGPVFGLYEKEYNNTITGQDWVYPEFKGYYSDLYAVRIHSTKGPDITIVSEDEGRFLQLFRPQRPVYYSKNVDPAFPNADISVLNTIPGIGTKFSRADQEGPQGKKAHFDNQTVEGTIYLIIK